MARKYTFGLEMGKRKWEMGNRDWVGTSNLFISLQEMKLFTYRLKGFQEIIEKRFAIFQIKRNKVLVTFLQTSFRE
jgi:hypothetical protein